MLDILATFGGWYDLPAHLSYLILAISFFVTNIYWLRILVIVSFLFEIVYFSMLTSYLWSGIAWDLVFVAINLYRLADLLRARRMVNLASGGHLLRTALPNMKDEGLAQLVALGEEWTLGEGEALTRQGEPAEAFFLIMEGRTRVEVDGVRVGAIGRGEFVGEISFLTGISATATVVADGPVRLIALNRDRLAQACRDNAEVSAVIHEVIGEALARKLVSANRRTVADVQAQAG
ncbi:Crp/Fnr family transcriptional regulator [Prosthecomicrobium pneumaticum]|uniref:CRP-like cAMP-binding protein n=1 Tax=Prosthecomicrobium pneumaticum TaxID=81895 RepID=A0A7W9FL90_9HYPH|nr:cyclic nucleotide-binding domain-containing protein [Prosthecomicrobium pneumaticum]MBB5752489.1 CRP-like cAMP-binding protein [Prosthecomicrobium pneumaticum]